MPQQQEKTCPNCQVTLPQEGPYCPHCGIRLTNSAWRKLGAWILLILICYGLVRCHVLLLDGFPETVR